tara:strand:- start:87 stop:884 length:798 start_codon:yes stop_codon:yes gene_type:complete
MSETLSYQEPQNVTTVDNLTAEEQDSLAVGESISQQEEQVYAGKYKSAQELEKAYIELQAKLGEKKEETETETASAEEQPEDTPKMSEGATLITDASKEYFDNGNKLSPETMAKFSSMSSQDLIKAYMEVSQNPEFQQQGAPPAEITTSQINQIKNSAGGEQQYAQIVNWAKTNLPEDQITAFDEVVNTGSVQAIQLAVSGLKAEYDNANGVEGRMVTGKAPQNSGDVFRSQQELVAAMNDPRYDRDPAYRQDVIQKLDRSDLEF